MDREVEAEHDVDKAIEPDELARSIETILRKAEVALQSLTFSMKKHTLMVMKRSLLRWLILPSFLLLLCQGLLVGADFPRPSGLINDFAGLIPQGDKQRMDMLAKEVLQKTGTSVVVATMQAIGDADVPTYATQLYQAWGIGKKGEDKGVLIFMALKERRIRIETGYGVEGILPDGLVGEILDKYAVPFLKKDQYGKGLYNALAAVSQVIAKDANVQLTGDVKVYRPPRRASRRRSLFPLLFFILILFSLLRRGSRRRIRRIRRRHERRGRRRQGLLADLGKIGFEEFQL
jgi:uncharacterized protein